MAMRTAGFVATLAVCACALGGGAAGCELVASADRNLIPTDAGPPDAGTGGTPGVGGGGHGGVAGTGGGGMGGGGECVTPLDCPDPMNECVLRECTNGTCAQQNVTENTLVGMQVEGDCKAIVCDGMGATIAIPDDTDALDDMMQCTDDGCANTNPVHSASQQGMPCTDDGGKVCDGAKHCVECNANGDCAPNSKCSAHVCVPVTCLDGIKNGTETAIDCGGASCPGCPDGETCAGPTDCQSDGCCGAPMVCDACCNGAEDGNETGQDCGGPDCNPCPDFETCLVDIDCQSGVCEGGLCYPAACGDGQKNGTESDVDCGGTVCPECVLGQSCGDFQDCASNFCADGVCCDVGCGSLCEACTTALKGSGTDGLCGPIAAGTDPGSECAAQNPMTCGTVGSCSGAGTCALHAAGTVCVAQSCTGGVQQNVDTCNGTGVCMDGGTVACAPYVCGTTSCKTSCAVDADCAAGNHCAPPSCVAN